MAILSGPSALDALAVFIALSVISSVISMVSSRLFFLMFFVTVLAVLELLCGIIEENCLLKLSAIFLGFEIYFPLNLIASFSLAFAPPFRFLINLKSLDVSLFLFSIVSRHFSRLCSFMISFISLFSTGILWSVGFVCLKLSLSFIFVAAIDGTSGKMDFSLPAGMERLATLLMIFLNAFSPLWTELGAVNFENSTSVSVWNWFQSAFLKLMNTLKSLMMGFISVSSLTIMGRWSDPNSVLTSQLA